MARRPRAPVLQRRPLGPHTVLQLLALGVPQQAAGLHPAQPDPAVWRQLRRLRQAQRRAQRHAVRLRRVRQGRPDRPPAEARAAGRGGGQLHRRVGPAGGGHAAATPGAPAPAGLRRGGGVLDVPAPVGQALELRADARQREPAPVPGHRQVVPVGLQRRDEVVPGHADRHRGRGRVDDLPERLLGQGLVLPRQVRLHRRLPGERSLFIYGKRVTHVGHGFWRNIGKCLYLLAIF